MKDARNLKDALEMGRSDNTHDRVRAAPALADEVDSLLEALKIAGLYVNGHASHNGSPAAWAQEKAAQEAIRVALERKS